MRNLCRSTSNITAITVLVFSSAGASTLFAQRLDSPILPTNHNWANVAPITEQEHSWTHAEPAVTPPAQQPLKSDGRLSISAEELRHPLSRKGRKIIAEAEKYSHSGDHAKAIEALTLALKEPSAAPYAHNLLGVEYLRTRKTLAAIDELQKANELMPGLPAGHSNLGFALCRIGQVDKGLAEIERALTLDQTFLKARFLKAVILMDRGLRTLDVRESLELAQKEIPTAHLALAIFYAKSGHETAAQQQLQDYSELGFGISLTQAQKWLTDVVTGGSPGAALGLWAADAERR